MMNEIKLLPCPFCGGDPIIQQVFGLQLWESTCIWCETKIHYRPSKQEAISAWNNRYEEPNEPLSLIQDLMQKLESAKYSKKILADEDNDIRNFSEGYNRCIANIQVMLIMEHGAKPIFQPKRRMIMNKTKYGKIDKTDGYFYDDTLITVICMGRILTTPRHDINMCMDGVPKEEFCETISVVSLDDILNDITFQFREHSSAMNRPLITVIVESPMSGHIYRYGNNGAFWELIGDMWGYA